MTFNTRKTEAARKANQRLSTPKKGRHYKPNKALALVFKGIVAIIKIATLAKNKPPTNQAESRSIPKTRITAHLTGVARGSRAYFKAPKTFSSTALPAATGFWRIFFSSSPIIR